MKIRLRIIHIQITQSNCIRSDLFMLPTMMPGVVYAGESLSRCGYQGEEGVVSGGGGTTGSDNPEGIQDERGVPGDSQDEQG